ncbi:MAG: type II toxin-antitoxin system RelE family toxin [Gemmatimonadota bacterium]
MASYSVFLKRSAAGELEVIADVEDRRRIVDRIRSLSRDPRPIGSVKLAGREDRLRVRQGEYRIVYKVDDRDATVMIVKIGHRRDVHR